MNRPDYIPADYKRIAVVQSLSDLFNCGYADDEENLILHPRRLTRDFTSLARDLYKTHAGHPYLQDSGKLPLASHLEPEGWWSGLKPQHDEAVSIIRADFDALLNRPKRIGVQLRLVSPAGYSSMVINTFHADGQDYDEPWETASCCYTKEVTEGVRNEDTTRACDFFGSAAPRYDLSTDPQIFSFRAGDFWLQRNNGRGVENPFIHRPPAPGLAPATQEPRLVLMGFYKLNG